MEAILRCGVPRKLNTIWDTTYNLNTGGSDASQELFLKEKKGEKESMQDRETYYYGVMQDVEGIPWNYNHKDELRYKHLTNGVHILIPFLGPTCNL